MAEQSKALTKYESVATYLQRADIRQTLGDLLKGAIAPERIVKILLGACRRNPALLECTLPSLAETMIQAASLGLEVGDVLGTAYAVPFRNSHTGKKEATLILGYRGLLELAYRHPQVLAIQAGVVAEGDEFSYELGSESFVKHRRSNIVATAENITGAWAAITYCKADHTATVVSYMPRVELDAHRARSRAANDGPWVTDLAPMCLKTVTKGALNLAPKTRDLMRALAVEAAAELGVSTDGIFDVEAPPVDAESEPATGPDSSPIRDEEIPE